MSDTETTQPSTLESKSGTSILEPKSGTSRDFFIGRQPILNIEQNLAGYELLFRSGRENFADVEDDLGASAVVIWQAFADLGIETALGPYKGFINCDKSILVSEVLNVLPAEKIVLEILEKEKINPDLVDLCQYLKSRGFTLALDDFTQYQDKYIPLLGLVDYVKVDITRLDESNLEKTTQTLSRWSHLKLVAEKVESLEQAKYCRDLGYSLFQGYYFARPTILTGRKLGHSEMALIRLLGLVLEDADTRKLEELFKHEPGLALNLMRLTNSAATGIQQRITSLRHAITVLGRRQLQRWLQLLLYTNPAGDSVTSPLLQLAATRGRLMELFAGHLQQGNQSFEDHAFMTGIMSLMPTLMNTSMDMFLNSIALVPDVRSALEAHNGKLGIMLSLTEALESSDGLLCHDLAAKLPGLTSNIINTCLAQAMSWASSIGVETEVSG